MVFYGFYNLGLCEFGKSLSFRSDFESEYFKIITVNKYHRSQIKCNCWTNCHKSEKPSICQSVTFRKFRDSRIIFTEIKLFRFYWTGKIIFLNFFVKSLVKLVYLEGKRSENESRTDGTVTNDDGRGKEARAMD